MSTQVLLVIFATTTVILLGVLIGFLVVMHRAMASMVAILRSLHHEALPLLADLRDIGTDMKDSAHELRAGMLRVSKLSRALGEVGDDVQQGRQAVRAGLQALRGSLEPFLDRFRGWRGRLGGGAPSPRGSRP